MGRSAVLLADEKSQDLENYPNYSQEGHELSSSARSHSMRSDLEVSASPMRAFVKWALICTVILLAMNFAMNFFEPQNSKACRSLEKLHM